MNRIITTLLCLPFALITTKAWAFDYAFKKEFAPKFSGFLYLIVSIFLLLLLLFLAKKQKKTADKKSLIKVIMKSHLGNKTTLYVIEYQTIRFLLANNQQALVLERLSTKSTPEGSHEDPSH